MDIGTEKPNPMFIPIPDETPVPTRQPVELPEPAPASPSEVPAGV